MKSIEDATNDVATFMYGLKWWENENLKKEIFIDKKFEKFENLKPVWEKMALNTKQTFGKKEVHEVFSDVVGEMYMYNFGNTLEGSLLIATSESLKTLDKG